MESQLNQNQQNQVQNDGYYRINTPVVIFPHDNIAENQQNQNQNNTDGIIGKAFDIFVETNIARIEILTNRETIEKMLDVSELKQFGMGIVLKGELAAFEIFLAEKTFEEKCKEGLPPDEALASAIAGVIGGFIGLSFPEAGVILAPLLSNLGSEFVGVYVWRLVRPYFNDYADKVWHYIQEGLRRIDPLVIDLNGDGIKLVNINKSNAMFDLTGSGFANKTGWISSGDAFLVWDKNNNGRIDDISEMFGNANQSGFKALALYDTNRDGKIDASDDVFKNLKVWVDRNGDGRTDEGELLSLSDVGIKAIDLNTVQTNINQEGNTITEVGSVEFEDGRKTQIGSVNFELDRLYSYYNREVELNPEIVGLPWVRGYGFMPDLPIAMSLDNTLLQMVKDAVAETDLTKLKEKFEKIIFRWAGVENATKQDLFGSNIRFGIRFDDEKNRVLHFDDGTILRYEQIGAALKFTGTTKEDLRGNAVIGQKYLEAWNTMFQGLFTRFVVDAGLLENVLPAYYDFFTDKITIDENFDINAYELQIKQMISSQDLNQINIALMSLMVLKETNLLDPQFIAELYTDFAKNPEALTSPYLDFLFNNVILGTKGDDSLYGTNQKDIIYGQEGDDILYGNGGDDTLIGGVGNDKLYGGDGNDVLIGGPGNDYLEGGRGNDTYIFNKGDGQDTIVNDKYWDGYWNGLGTLKFGEGITKDDVEFTKDGDDLVVIIKGTNDSIRVKNWFYRNWFRLDKVEFADGTKLTINDIEQIGYKIYGTSGNDTLNGSGVKDIIYGQEGDDILYGNGGDDTLIGGVGNDKLYGGDGNDVLIGGPGNDYLEGGRGNDTYIFNKGDGQDTIVNDKYWDGYWNGLGTLKFGEGITKDGIVFFKDNNDLIIGYSNNDFVKVLDQFKGKNYGIEKIEVKDGYYITRSDIENIVNAMIDFTNDKGMSYAEMYNNLLNNQNYTMLLSQNWKQLNYSGGITQ